MNATPRTYIATAATTFAVVYGLMWLGLVVIP